MLPPSAVTVVVPFARVEEYAVFVYGTGFMSGGVLQKSGSVDLARPSLPLWTSERPLTLIVTAIRH